MDNLGSPLQRARRNYAPQVPAQLKEFLCFEFSKGEKLSINEKLAHHFPTLTAATVLYGKIGSEKKYQPKRVGVVFSGGPAPGGHNVVTGLFDAIKKMHPQSQLIGFRGGPKGIVEGNYFEITEELLLLYRNQGGFDLLGSGRPKIETEEDLGKTVELCNALDLDTIVLIGGDDSNTNGALIANYLLTHGCKTTIIGIPKTIDADLRSDLIDTTFGFDTACKVYSESIGNIATDAASAGKYYHFIKVMGRAASHIALECALQTHPNLVFISEEIEEKKQSLKDIVMQIADLVVEREKRGKNFGVIVIPEGLVEFLVDVRALIDEISTSLEHPSRTPCLLSPASAETFNLMPEKIQKQLFYQHDPYGNVPLSQIETEQLLIELVKTELENRKKIGLFKGSFRAQHHFLGYEGRCALPSNFDCNYCYALGMTAAAAVHERVTGYICFVKKLHLPVEKWEVGIAPVATMLTVDVRNGVIRPFIRKKLVDLEGKPFKKLKEIESKWLYDDLYCAPGPIQFAGEDVLTQSITKSLFLELQEHTL